MLPLLVLVTGLCLPVTGEVTAYWQRIEGRGAPSQDGATCTLGRDTTDSIYVVGGRTASSSMWGPTVLSVFDFPSQTWSTPQLRLRPGEVFTPRNKHTTVEWSGKLYIFGGHTGVLSVSAEMWVLDVAQKTLALLAPHGDAPAGRFSHRAVVYGDKMYVYGGTKLSPWRSRVSVDELIIYCFTTNTWELTPKVTGSSGGPRVGHTMGVYEGHLYVFGGFDGDTIYYKDISRLEIATLTWTVVSSSMEARSAHSMERLGAIFVLIGGHNTDHHQRLGDVVAYDAKAEQWVRTTVTGQFESRQGHCSLVSAGDIYVFGGAADWFGAHGDLHVLTLNDSPRPSRTPPTSPSSTQAVAIPEVDRILVSLQEELARAGLVGDVPSVSTHVQDIQNALQQKLHPQVGTVDQKAKLCSQLEHLGDRVSEVGREVENTRRILTDNYEEIKAAHQAMVDAHALVLTHREAAEEVVKAAQIILSQKAEATKTRDGISLQLQELRLSSQRHHKDILKYEQDQDSRLASIRRLKSVAEETLSKKEKKEEQRRLKLKQQETLESELGSLTRRRNELQSAHKLRQDEVGRLRVLLTSAISRGHEFDMNITHITRLLADHQQLTDFLRSAKEALNQADNKRELWVESVKQKQEVQFNLPAPARCDACKDCCDQPSDLSVMEQLEKQLREYESLKVTAADEVDRIKILLKEADAKKEADDADLLMVGQDIGDRTTRLNALRQEEQTLAGEVERLHHAYENDLLEERTATKAWESMKEHLINLINQHNADKDRIGELDRRFAEESLKAMDLTRDLAAKRSRLVTLGDDLRTAMVRRETADERLSRLRVSVPPRVATYHRSVLSYNSFWDQLKGLMDGLQTGCREEIAQLEEVIRVQRDEIDKIGDDWKVEKGKAASLAVKKELLEEEKATLEKKNRDLQREIERLRSGAGVGGSASGSAAKARKRPPAKGTDL